jgi:Matrixin
MRAVFVAPCLAVLSCYTASAADPTYTLTVSRHASVRDFSENELKQIVRKASSVLQNAGCNVTFKVDGPVRTFSSASTPSNIATAADLDQVHSEATDVKIVKEIHCCAQRKGNFAGCSWPPKAGSRSIILTEAGATLGNRWAHEFGHRMGLPHRGDNHVLMTQTGVTAASMQVSASECRCFLNEGSCTLPPQPAPAPENSCPQ